MANLAELEHSYQRYIRDLSHWLPDGVTTVDLSMLRRLNLIDFDDPEFNRREPITHYFHVIESTEKITLFNDRFVVWIVPESHQEYPITYALIALREPEGPRLEMAYSTSGVYNSSRLVLRILEKLLEEIQETESELMKIKATT